MNRPKTARLPQKQGRLAAAAEFGRMMMRLTAMVFRGARLFTISIMALAVVHGLAGAASLPVQHILYDSIAKGAAGEIGAGSMVYGVLLLLAASLLSELVNGVFNFLMESLSKKAGGHMICLLHKKAGAVDPVCYEDPALLDAIDKARQGAQSGPVMALLVWCVPLLYGTYFAAAGAYLYALKPILLLSLAIIFVPMMLLSIVRASTYAKLEEESAPIRRKYEYYERAIFHREFFKETRILGAFSYFHKLYKEALSLLNCKTWKADLKTNGLEGALRTLTLIGYGGILAMLFQALMAGEISVGAFSAVFASLGMLFSIMEELVCRHFGHISRTAGALKNFMRYLDMPERRGQVRLSDAGPRSIALDNVHFRYPGAKTDALSGISLKLAPGSSIAVVGQNGSGKSTLVRLMTGIYLPTSGSVTIDGVHTREISLDSLFRGLSGVFQKFQRYRFTLKDNIQAADMHAHGGENLDRAARQAELDAHSASFPQGYDTMLSREFEGVELSGGQWQRVAIARGFYRDHGMIVLDEPTAAIDPIEETRVYQNFARISQGKTAVIVTHRLGSAKIADSIVVMEAGKIVETGTHDALMAQNGAYARMYRAQSEWYAV